jgi:hypothetical protein
MGNLINKYKTYKIKKYYTDAFLKCDESNNCVSFNLVKLSVFGDDDEMQIITDIAKKHKMVLGYEYHDEYGRVFYNFCLQ